MTEDIRFSDIDLRQLNREDVENIPNPTLRRAVINALFLQTVAQGHTNHNSHSDHTKYTQSIKDQALDPERVLDLVFGHRERKQTKQSP
jgi:hypothetical protein